MKVKSFLKLANLTVVTLSLLSCSTTFIPTTNNAPISIVNKSKNASDYNTFSLKNASTVDMDFKIDQATVRDQSKPSVFIDSFGNGIAVWHDNRNQNQNKDIYARAISNYVMSGNDFRIDQSLYGEQFNPDINLDNSGNGLIVWQDTRDGNSYIYGRKIVAFQPSGNDFKIESTNSAIQTDPAIYINTSGNGLIVWDDERNGVKSIMGIKVNNFQVSGSSFKINTLTGGDQTKPDISLTNSGDGFIVWSDTAATGSGGGDIYAIKISNFAISGTQFKVDQGTSGQQSVPKISLNSLGNGLITWQDKRGSKDKIYARAIKNLALSGNEFLAEVTDSGSNQRNPSVSIDKLGNGLITWDDSRNNNFSIYGVEVSNLSTASNKAFRVDKAAVAAQSLSNISFNESGNGLVVWSDFRTGLTQDIYGIKITGVGVTSAPFITRREFFNFLDANAFTSYGEFDYGADIAYAGQFLDYYPKSCNPISNGYLRIKGVVNDLYAGDTNFNIRVIFNGEIIYDGNNPFPKGEPPLSGHFNNWKTLEIPITNIKSDNSLYIINNGTDWIGIDSIELGDSSNPVAGFTKAPFITEDVPFIDRLGAKAYVGYGEFDYGSDIAYENQYLRYKVIATNKTSPGFIRLKGARNDYYEGSTPNSTKVIFNGKVVFDGTTQFPAGFPKNPLNFKNWYTMEIPVDCVQDINDLYIVNKGPDWLGIDTLNINDRNEPALDFTKSSFITNTNFLDSLEATAWTSYGEFDYGADIAYSGQYLEYNAKSSSTITNGYIRLKGVINDLSTNSTQANIRVMFNGLVVFDGNVPFPKGSPELSGHFDNWYTLDIPVSAINPENNLKIFNKGADWVAIDSIELSNITNPLSSFSKSPFNTYGSFSQSRDLGAYTSYGFNDYASDIVYANQYSQYNVKTDSTNANGTLKLKLIRNDLYSGTDPVTIKVMLNGKMVYSNVNSSIPKGLPALSTQFNNWYTLEIPVSNLNQSNILQVMNLGPDWVGIDGIEVVN